MEAKKSTMYWVLNAVATLQLFLIANLFIAALIMLHARSHPLEITVIGGVLWPVDLVFGKTYPTLFSVASAVLGIFTALKYRSSWGAAVATALVVLTVIHYFVSICLHY